MATRGGRDREALVQAGKAALAAVLALLLLRWAGREDGDQAFLAPFAAVLTVTSTVRRAWWGAARQAAMVPAGVLLAYAAGRWLPIEVGLATVVVAGLLVGRWRMLGDDGWWIAITALLLLLNGAAWHPLDLATWVLFSVGGSVVGAVVNTVVLPPLHLQDARVAVDALAREIAGRFRDTADGVRAGWNAEDAASWARQARGVRVAVRRASDAVWMGRESVRWNPRRRRIGSVDTPLAAPTTVERLDRVAERAVHVTALLGDLAEPGDRAPDPALADQIDRLADAVDLLHERTTDDPPRPDASLHDVRAGPADEPAHVRSACLVVIADALGDLGRPL